ncbi:MAG: hypothetical protein GY853_15725 [PVC group bacterium]|nr:hypothetical protein [PVC group bacterium]
MKKILLAPLTTIIALMLSFFGCKQQPVSTNTQDKSKQESSPKGTALNHARRRMPELDKDAKSTIIEVARITKLNRTSQWKEFKRFWKELHTRWLDYNHNTAKSASSDLEQKLESISLDKLISGNKLTALEGEILLKICAFKIDDIAIEEDPTKAMYSRMLVMPSYSKGQSTYTMKSLPNNIKRFIDGKMTRETLDKTAMHASESLQNFSLIDNFIISYKNNYTSRDFIQQYISNFRKSFEDLINNRDESISTPEIDQYYTNLSKMYSRTQKDIAKIEEISESLHQLVVDLTL